MSFGVIQAMITSLKNNEKMRTKRIKFKHVPGKRSGIKPQYDFPEATSEMLIEIQKRIKREKKLLWIKVMMLSVLIIGILVWMIYAS